MLDHGQELLALWDELPSGPDHASLYLYTNEQMSENIAMYAKVGYAEYERRQEEGFRRAFLRKVLR